ncbi:MAG TPA: PEGA domain-containing protein [Polyangiaceae bacterium]
MRQTGLLLVGLLALATVRKAAAEPSNSELAADHFQQGLSHARSGDIDAAAADFEAAYKASPNFAVLYNLGRTYAAMGRAVDAVSAFKRYLSEGGSAIDSKRRDEVANSITFNERRIGLATISAVPESAQVLLDGKAVVLTGASLPLVTGDHVLVVMAHGYQSAARAFSVQHASPTSIHVELSKDALPVVPPEVWLSIACDVPGVAVLLDALPYGNTPLRTPVAVTEEAHRITFQRPGYTSTTINWAPGASPSLDCGVKLSKLAPSETATLAVTPSEPDAQTFVDGVRWAPAPLPFGQHRLELKKFGFQTWDTNIELRSGEHKRMGIRLVPEPEYAEEHRGSIRRQRSVGYVLAGVGSGLLVAAATLELLSSHAYADLRQRRDTADRTPGTSPNYVSQQQDVERRSVQVRTLDDWSLSSAIVGSSVLLTGAVLLFTSEDPARYELPSIGAKRGGISVDWQRAF